MKKGIMKIIVICLLICSLVLNIFLLYEKIKDKSETVECINTEDVTNNSEEIEYTKEMLEKLFKNYQIESSLVTSDDIVKWDVTKITYVGYFKSNKSKKLYYIDESYTCIEGIDCIKASLEVKTDEKYNSKTTFVVAVTPVDKNNALFEILDYSIEKDKDFVSVKNTELK